MFWLTCSLVRDRLPEILRLPSMPVVSSAAAAGMLLHDGLKKASFVLVILGAFMLVRERSRYGKRMRMSKQDIRDENRETEGNPQIKARIRRLQRDMRRKNMMREVATATAVVVNPTHYAVALRYDQAGMTAPQGGRQGAKITSPRAFASVPLKIWYQSLRILPSRRHCISPWKSGRRYHRIFTVR
jgi:flagellar biosynthetic protein FlhB